MATTPEPLAALVAKQVRRWREERNWTAVKLAEEMQGVGLTGWDRFTVRNLEQHRRKSVSVDELLALAYVLNVPPVSLVIPPEVADGDQFEVTPTVTAPAGQVREW